MEKKYENKKAITKKGQREEIKEHPLCKELWEGVAENTSGLPNGDCLFDKNPWQFLALADKIYNDLFQEYVSTKDRDEKLRLTAEMAGLEAASISVKLGLEGF